MPSLWRISQYADLKGVGGLKANNRWNSKGRPIVYLAATTSGVILEYLVHTLERTVIPDCLKLLEVSYPTTTKVQVVEESTLSINWTTDIAATRNIGDTWLRELKTPLLDVPSVIVPASRNFLLNPNHPDAKLISVRRVYDFTLDSRLRQLVEYALSYRDESSYTTRES